MIEAFDYLFSGNIKKFSKHMNSYFINHIHGRSYSTLPGFMDGFLSSVKKRLGPDVKITRFKPDLMGTNKKFSFSDLGYRIEYNGKIIFIEMNNLPSEQKKIDALTQKFLNQAKREGTLEHSFVESKDPDIFKKPRALQNIAITGLYGSYQESLLEGYSGSTQEERRAYKALAMAKSKAQAESSNPAKEIMCLSIDLKSGKSRQPLLILNSAVTNQGPKNSAPLKDKSLAYDFLDVSADFFDTSAAIQGLSKAPERYPDSIDFSMEDKAAHKFINALQKTVNIVQPTLDLPAVDENYYESFLAGVYFEKIRETKEYPITQTQTGIPEHEHKGGRIDFETLSREQHRPHAQRCVANMFELKYETPVKKAKQQITERKYGEDYGERYIGIEKIRRMALSVDKTGKITWASQFVEPKKRIRGPAGTPSTAYDITDRMIGSSAEDFETFRFNLQYSTQVDLSYFTDNKRSPGHFSNYIAGIMLSGKSKGRFDHLYYPSNNKFDHFSFLSHVARIENSETKNVAIIFQVHLNDRENNNFLYKDILLGENRKFDRIELITLTRGADTECDITKEEITEAELRASPDYSEVHTKEIVSLGRSSTELMKRFIVGNDRNLNINENLISFTRASDQIFLSEIGKNRDSSIQTEEASRHGLFLGLLVDNIHAHNLIIESDKAGGPNGGRPDIRIITDEIAHDGDSEKKGIVIEFKAGDQSDHLIQEGASQGNSYLSDLSRFGVTSAKRHVIVFHRSDEQIETLEGVWHQTGDSAESRSGTETQYTASQDGLESPDRRLLISDSDNTPDRPKKAGASGIAAGPFLNQAAGPYQALDPQHLLKSSSEGEEPYFPPLKRFCSNANVLRKKRSAAICMESEDPNEHVSFDEIKEHLSWLHSENNAFVPVRSHQSLPSVSDRAAAETQNVINLYSLLGEVRAGNVYGVGNWVGVNIMLPYMAQQAEIKLTRLQYSEGMAWRLAGRAAWMIPKALSVAPLVADFVYNIAHLGTNGEAAVAAEKSGIFIVMFIAPGMEAPAVALVAADMFVPIINDVNRLDEINALWYIKAGQFFRELFMGGMHPSLESKIERKEMNQAAAIHYYNLVMNTSLRLSIDTVIFSLPGSSARVEETRNTGLTKTEISDVDLDGGPTTFDSCATETKAFTQVSGTTNLIKHRDRPSDLSTANTLPVFTPETAALYCSPKSEENIRIPDRQCESFENGLPPSCAIDQLKERCTTQTIVPEPSSQELLIASDDRSTCTNSVILHLLPHNAAFRKGKDVLVIPGPENTYFKFMTWVDKPHHFFLEAGEVDITGSPSSNDTYVFGGNVTGKVRGRSEFNLFDFTHYLTQLVLDLARGTVSSHANKPHHLEISGYSTVKGRANLPDHVTFNSLSQPPANTQVFFDGQGGGDTGDIIEGPKQGYKQLLIATLNANDTFIPYSENQALRVNRAAAGRITFDLSQLPQNQSISTDFSPSLSVTDIQAMTYNATGAILEIEIGEDTGIRQQLQMTDYFPSRKPCYLQLEEGYFIPILHNNSLDASADQATASLQVSPLSDETKSELLDRMDDIENSHIDLIKHATWVDPALPASAPGSKHSITIGGSKSDLFMDSLISKDGSLKQYFQGKEESDFYPVLPGDDVTINNCAEDNAIDLVDVSALNADPLKTDARIINQRDMQLHFKNSDGTVLAKVLLKDFILSLERLTISSYCGHLRFLFDKDDQLRKLTINSESKKIWFLPSIQDHVLELNAKTKVPANDLQRMKITALRLKELKKVYRDENDLILLGDSINSAVVIQNFYAGFNERIQQGKTRLAILLDDNTLLDPKAFKTVAQEAPTLESRLVHQHHQQVKVYPFRNSDVTIYHNYVPSHRQKVGIINLRQIDPTATLVAKKQGGDLSIEVQQCKATHRITIPHYEQAAASLVIQFPANKTVSMASFFSNPTEKPRHFVKRLNRKLRRTMKEIQLESGEGYLNRTNCLQRSEPQISESESVESNNLRLKREGLPYSDWGNDFNEKMASSASSPSSIMGTAWNFVSGATRYVADYLFSAPKEKPQDRAAYKDRLSDGDEGNDINETSSSLHKPQMPDVSLQTPLLGLFLLLVLKQSNHSHKLTDQEITDKEKNINRMIKAVARKIPDSDSRDRVCLGFLRKDFCLLCKEYLDGKHNDAIILSGEKATQAAIQKITEEIEEQYFNPSFHSSPDAFFRNPNSFLVCVAEQQKWIQSNASGLPQNSNDSVNALNLG